MSTRLFVCYIKLLNKILLKEYMMVNGKCPHCGSSEVYVSDNPFHNTFLVKTDSESDVFAIQCYLCLGCRSMELKAAEKSPSLFGKTASIVVEVPKSDNWKKVV